MSEVSVLVNAEGFIQASDGVRLFCRRWEAPNPRGICLLVHGLGEHSGRYDGLAQALNARNLSVWAMDHRGHGRSEGRRGDCRSVEEFIQDLHQLVEEVKGKIPQQPRILIGHSLGGLIALMYAVEHPLEIRAVAVSSPALRLAKEPPKIKVALAEGLGRILPTTPIPNGVDPQLLSHDPQVVENYQKDPLVHRVVTARCALSLRKAMAESFLLAPQLKVPCLILQAGSDSICDPAAAAEFASQVRAAPVTFHRYDGLYHEIFNEPERHRVIEDLCHWIEEAL